MNMMSTKSFRMSSLMKCFSGKDKGFGHLNTFLRFSKTMKNLKEVTTIDNITRDDLFCISWMLNHHGVIKVKGLQKMKKEELFNIVYETVENN